MKSHQTRLGRILAAGIALAAAAGLSACSPITTKVQYAASDGVRVALSDTVTVQNLLIVSAAEGEPGALQGGVVNNGAQDETVTIGAVTVQVAAGQTVLMGGTAGEEVVLPTVAAAPGANLTLPVAVVGGASEDVFVPVLDGTLSEYADLVPTAAG